MLREHYDRTRPDMCDHPRKSWWYLWSEAEMRAKEYGMTAYVCFDHWHIGHSYSDRMRKLQEAGV